MNKEINKEVGYVIRERNIERERSGTKYRYIRNRYVIRDIKTNV